MEVAGQPRSSQHAVENALVIKQRLSHAKGQFIRCRNVQNLRNILSRDGSVNLQVVAVLVRNPVATAAAKADLTGSAAQVAGLREMNRVHRLAGRLPDKRTRDELRDRVRNNELETVGGLLLHPQVHPVIDAVSFEIRKGIQSAIPQSVVKGIGPQQNAQR